MKKFLGLLFTLAMIHSISNAQTLTKSMMSLSKSATFYEYTGASADSLSVNQDTIIFPFYVNKDYPIAYYGDITMSPISTTDTTATLQVLGKVFSDDNWSVISTETTSAISTNLKIVFKSITNLQDTTDNAQLIKYYRYLGLRVIIKGNDATGTGAKVNRVRLKIWEVKY